MQANPTTANDLGGVMIEEDRGCRLTLPLLLGVLSCITMHKS